MPNALFVYGTLMADEVVKVLLHRVPERRPAVLKGYARHRIKQQVFPALTPAAPDESVQGSVLSGLSEQELVVLDEYEDVDYYRTTERPALEDGSSTEAYVYVWQEEMRSLLDEGVPWDYEEFRQRHLPAYLNMTGEFLEEFIRDQTAMAPAEARGALNDIGQRVQQNLS